MTTRIFKLGSARASIFVAVAAATLAMSAPASAESSFCARLQSDYLSAVRSGGGGGGGASRSDYNRLRREVAAAEAEAKAKNCRGLGIFRKAARSCPAVMSKLGRLQRQLSQASGGSFVSSRRQSSDRDRIYSQLRRNGCGVPSLGDTASSGYRTLCVRTCDGFYFPISFSSSRSRFKIDETVCKSMYGGADAELFIHSNGRAADTAVSLQGTPLSSQSYAFAYRSNFNPSCQGELKRGLANLAEAFAAQVAAAKTNAPAAEGTPAPQLLPRPMARVNPARDPETQANRTGRFAVVPVEPEDNGEFTIASTVIRRLGPEYYYTAPATIDALYETPDFGPEFSLISSAHAAEPGSKADGPTGSTTVQ